LAGALRKSLDVDSIESRLLQRIGNRQPLEQDLVDYIRGRDEFLNETDGMLERLKVTASKMDTSDPRTRKAIADHGNYLFTLRGRQNKRYIETLKANMDSYDAQTQSLNAVYETKMDEYKTRLATGASILSSEYGMMMDGLKEMYQMAVDSDPNSFAYKKSQAELDSAQYKAVKDALEMEKLMNGINGGFGDGVTDVVEIAKAMKDLNYVDNNGRLQPGAYMANIGNYNGPTHAKFLVDSYMRALTLPDANKNPISASQAKETASSLLTSLDMMYQEQKIDSATYVSFLDQINGSLGATLTREMAGSTAAITGALKKIEEGTGWFKYVPPTEEKLLEGITDPATQDVIKYLYRIFEPVKTEPGSFSAIFKNGDTELPDNLKLQKVMEMYAKSLLPVQNESASPGFSQVGGDTNIAQRIAQTIKTIESGGDYRAKGASGERGAYQFMKSSWQDWAGQYLGNPNAPLTPQNQDAVAIARINDLLSQGYQPDQVALIWNGGSPTIKKGVNSMGVEYDTGAYLQKFKNNFS